MSEAKLAKAVMKNNSTVFPGLLTQDYTKPDGRARLRAANPATDRAKPTWREAATRPLSALSRTKHPKRSQKHASRATQAKKST
jgi:hypothetical protein